MKTASTTLIAIDISDDEQADAEIKRNGAALRRARRQQPAGQFPGPGLDMLDGDHHDRCRQHGTRDVGEQWKQQRRSQQHRDRIDDDRERAASAESAVGEARSDIDTVGDAAKAGRDRIREPKTDKKLVIARAELARLAGQPARTAARRSRQ